MFSIAARVGNEFFVNDVPVEGIDLDRTIENGVDEFGATSVGWDGDDQRVDEHLVNQPATATLSREGSIEAWAEYDDGTRRGSEIRASTDRSLGLDAHFVGEDSEAQFQAWGDLDSRITSPHHSLNINTPWAASTLSRGGGYSSKASSTCHGAKKHCPGRVTPSASVSTCHCIPGSGSGQCSPTGRLSRS
jgi:hypothetical protein